MPQNTSDLYLELYYDVWCNNTNDWGSALTIDHFIPVTKFIYNRDILLALTTDFDLRIHTFGSNISRTVVSNIFVIGRTI